MEKEECVAVIAGSCCHACLELKVRGFRNL